MAKKNPILQAAACATERELNKHATEALRQTNEDGLERLVIMTPNRKFSVLTFNKK